jgi:hypothetical protein
MRMYFKCLPAQISAHDDPGASTGRQILSLVRVPQTVASESAEFGVISAGLEHFSNSRAESGCTVPRVCLARGRGITRRRVCDLPYQPMVGLESGRVESRSQVKESPL